MFAFVRRRVVSSLLPLVVVAIGVFCLARLTGNPARLYLPINASKEARAEFSARNGFDDPVLVQLFDYLRDIVNLDFGTSLRTGEPAVDMVIRAFPATIQLAATTMVIALVVAIGLGGLAATNPGGIIDRFVSTLSMVTASIPDFWLAIVGIMVFSASLGWLPTSGSTSSAHWVLPVLTLVIRPLGVLVQIVRGAMIEALGASYVKFAKSKGAGEVRIVFGHALRNAAAPVLTVAGDLTVGLVNGAVVVETIFGWPGIGRLMIESILQRDFAVLQAAVLLIAVTIFVLNILIDVAYALLDARVRTVAPL